jgi:plasmid stabilization system protein ParE
VARQVRILPRAEADLRGIVANIRQRVSVGSAQRWSGLLRAAVEGLADSAESYTEADEAAALGRDLRVRLAGKRPHVYRIVFTYTADEVFVHRVRHAAQDLLTEGDI